MSTTDPLSPVLDACNPRNPCRLTHRIINLSKIGALLLIFSFLTWTLVRYGERTHDEVEVICKDRAQQAVGFQGDPDFYGLGIRIGLYLQWMSALVTNWFTPAERRAVITAYIVFSISITAAILVKIFSRKCTFVAEMFVVLTMFWGGLNVVLLPLLHAAFFEGLVTASNETTMRKLSLRNRDFEGLKWSMSLLNYFMSPITIWFWARLAAVGYRDFYSTPGGSSLYCFARISEYSIRAFSIFMSIISATNFTWFNYVSLPLRVDQSSGDEDQGLVASAPLVRLIHVLSLPVISLLSFLNLVFAWIGILLVSVIEPLFSIFKSSHQLAINSPSTDNEALLLNSKFSPWVSMPKTALCMTCLKRCRTECLFTTLLSLWCIVGIELTLFWNSVSGIYDISTTGQVIPFVIGTGLLYVSTRNAIKSRTHDNKPLNRKNDVTAMPVQEHSQLMASSANQEEPQFFTRAISNDHDSKDRSLRPILTANF